MEIYFLKILSIFHAFKNTIYWDNNLVSKCNGRHRPGTFTMKPEIINISLNVKLHVALEATILVPLPFRWHAPLRFSVSWSPGRHWKWRIRWTSRGPGQSISSWPRLEASALASKTKIMISLEPFNPLSDLLLLQKCLIMLMILNTIIIYMCYHWLIIRTH